MCGPQEASITPQRCRSAAFVAVVALLGVPGHGTQRHTGRPPEAVKDSEAPQGQISGDPVVAAAILERLMRNAVVFNIKGSSWRLREHHNVTTATATT